MTDFSEAYQELMYRLCKLQDRLDKVWLGEYRVYLSYGKVGLDVYRQGTYEYTVPEIGDVEEELLSSYEVNCDYDANNDEGVN